MSGNFLPMWIIGAPLVFAIIDRFMTPGSHTAAQGPVTANRG